MSELPILPLWVNKYDGGTAHLSLEEDGAFMRLLRLCWKTPGCRIPDDPRWIRRMMRVDEETYGRVVRPILDEFFERKQGYWQSLRLLEEYERAWSMKRARAEAGAKGGKAKALKDKGEEPSNATILPEQTHDKSVAIHLPSPSHLNLEEKEPSYEGSKKKREVSSKGTRLPEDWLPSETMIEDALAIGEKLNIHFLRKELEDEADRFRDYWIAQPGAKGIKLDWPATWRNWIRRAAPNIRGAARENSRPARNASRDNDPFVTGEFRSTSIPAEILRRRAERAKGNPVEDRPDDGAVGHEVRDGGGELIPLWRAAPF
jgi:uncharacterized protein YdaU (DUF1376 family)